MARIFGKKCGDHSGGVPVTAGKVEEFLSPVDRLKLKQALGDLDKLKAARATSVKIGYAFEVLLANLFGESKVLKVQTRVQSTTGEIDLVITVLAGLSQSVPFLVKHTHLLAEAKCHQSALKSEWVTEMLTNLQHHGASLGLIFVYCKSRPVHVRSRQAIAMGVVGGKVVVPIGRKQFDDICAGGSVIGVLGQQFVDASVHTSTLRV